MNTKDSSAAGGSRAIRLYSPRECADLLNVSRATLSRLLSRGTLPSVILSKGTRATTYRIHPEELQRFIDERSSGNGSKN